jgi:hypothetical protein
VQATGTAGGFSSACDFCHRQISGLWYTVIMDNSAWAENSRKLYLAIDGYFVYNIKDTQNMKKVEKIFRKTHITEENL